MSNLQYESISKQTEQEITKKLAMLAGASFSIAFISLLFCGIIYTLLTLVINKGLSFPNWSLEGFTSLITLTLAIGGLVFAAVEYRNIEVQRAQERNTLAYNVYASLFERLTNLEEEAARRWIIKNIDPLKERETEEDWLRKFRATIKEGTEKKEDIEQPAEQAYIKRALNTLDYMGFIAQNYHPAEVALLKWMSPPVSKTWIRLEIYVKDERTRRNEPDWYDSAEYIGNACIQWREQEHYSKPEIVDDTV